MKANKIGAQRRLTTEETHSGDPDAVKRTGGFVDLIKFAGGDTPMVEEVGLLKDPTERSSITGIARGREGMMSFLTPPAMAATLKKVLFDEYGGFANKRVKNLEKSNLFIVDDRQPGDCDAKGKLFAWFCRLSVEVVDQNTVMLSFRGEIPAGPAVAQWFTELGASTSEFEVTVEIERGRQRYLKELAKAFRSIVRPGARYPVKAYKYTCPRVAASLDRLRTALDKAWR